VPEYSGLRAIKRVADWACGGDFEQAEQMQRDRPSMYQRILLIAEAESEAEPEGIAYARKKEQEKPRAENQAKKPRSLSGNRLT